MGDYFCMLCDILWQWLLQEFYHLMVAVNHSTPMRMGIVGVKQFVLCTYKRRKTRNESMLHWSTVRRIAMVIRNRASHFHRAQCRPHWWETVMRIAVCRRTFCLIWNAMVLAPESILKNSTQSKISSVKTDLLLCWSVLLNQIWDIPKLLVVCVKLPR